MGSSGPRQPRTHRSVFLSSTSRDLVTHRQQVIDTLLRMNLFPVAMEQFGAQDRGDATSVSTDKVAHGMVWWRTVACETERRRNPGFYLTLEGIRADQSHRSSFQGWSGSLTYHQTIP